MERLSELANQTKHSGYPYAKYSMETTYLEKKIGHFSCNSVRRNSLPIHVWHKSANFDETWREDHASGRISGLQG